MSRKEWKKDGYFYYDKIRPYVCKHCNQRFSDWDGYYHHYKYYKKKIMEQISASINPDYSEKFKEKAIQERMKENKDLKLLEKSYEENKRKRPFVCQYCGKTFRTKKGYKDHLKRIHGEDVDQLRKERKNKKNEEGSGNDSQ